MPQPTDLERQVLDNIAVGLGSRESWSGADELEWIANEIGRVRPHPDDCRTTLSSSNKRPDELRRRATSASNTESPH